MSFLRFKINVSINVKKIGVDGESNMFYYTLWGATAPSLAPHKSTYLTPLQLILSITLHWRVVGRDVRSFGAK